MTTTPSLPQVRTMDLPGGLTVALSEGLVYPLSPCCKASATGTVGGTACRSCYRSIPTLYGSCFLTSDAPEDVTRHLVEWMQELTLGTTPSERAEHAGFALVWVKA